MDSGYYAIPSLVEMGACSGCSACMLHSASDVMCYIWICLLILFLHVQLAHGLHRGSLSAPELCETCLKRFNKTRELNAFITMLPESALQSAEAAQQRILNGIS